MRKHVIRDKDGTAYLTRYFLIRTKWFRVFLHHIHRPDQDRHLHSHPWRKAVALILRGGYTEATLKYGRRTHTAGHINVLKEDDYHKIIKVLPNTWTLLFGGHRNRSWGFWQDGTHVDWKTYLNLPDEYELED